MHTVCVNPAIAVKSDEPLLLYRISVKL